MVPVKTLPSRNYLCRRFQSFVFLCFAGVFTATMAGTYVFHMHVRSDSTQRGSIEMKKNGKTICATWVNQDKGLREMAACSAVTELVPGDKLKVVGGREEPQAKITGNKMGFSGILIYPA